MFHLFLKVADQETIHTWINYAWDKLEQSAETHQAEGMDGGAGRRGAGRKVWRAMFLSSCVPPDNETELNSISIFSVCVQSLFLPSLKKKKKKPTPRTPPIDTGHTKVCSRSGNKVAVGNVLGRNNQHLFRALPKLHRDHFSLYQLFPCGTFSNSIAWITGRHSLNLIALGSSVGTQAPGATSPLSAVQLSSCLSLISLQLPFLFLLLVPFSPFLSEVDSLASLSVVAFNILLLPNRVLEAETGAAWTDQITKGTQQVGPQPSSHIWAVEYESIDGHVWCVNRYCTLFNLAATLSEPRCVSHPYFLHGQAR